MFRCYMCDCTFKNGGMVLDNIAICSHCEIEINFDLDLDYPLDDDTLDYPLDGLENIDL